MQYTKILYTEYEYYSCRKASNIEMEILGQFFSDEVGCGPMSCSYPTYQDWAQDDTLGLSISGNTIMLEKEDEYIFLQDMYSQELSPTRLKMPRQQMIGLLQAWREKVCKLKPKMVMIKLEHGEFSIETKD